VAWLFFGNRGFVTGRELLVNGWRVRSRCAHGRIGRGEPSERLPMDFSAPPENNAAHFSTRRFGEVLQPQWFAAAGVGKNGAYFSPPKKIENKGW
jgi:hypothetical protein